MGRLIGFYGSKKGTPRRPFLLCFNLENFDFQTFFRLTAGQAAKR